MGEAAGLQITECFVSEMKREVEDCSVSASRSCRRSRRSARRPQLSWEKNIVVSETAAGLFLRVCSWCNKCSSRQGAVVCSFQYHQCMSETGTLLLNGLL